MLNTVSLCHFYSVQQRKVFYKAPYVLCLKGYSFMLFVLFRQVCFSCSSHRTHIFQFLSFLHFISSSSKSLGIGQTRVFEVWLRTAAVILSSWFDQRTWNHKRSKLLFLCWCITFQLAWFKQAGGLKTFYFYTKCHHCCLSTLTSKTSLLNQPHQISSGYTMLVHHLDKLLI